MRRGHRRSYRRNPFGGGFIGSLTSLAKKAIPVLAGFYAARIITSKIGPMLPLTMLGTFQGPVTAVLTVVGANVLTSKVGFLARHKEPIMIGVGLSALDQIFRALAPASVQSMLGLGDDIYGRGLGEYVGTGEYVATGTALDDNMALSNYVQVGGDGVEEALGLEEELGIDEALGVDEALGDTAGGLAGPLAGPFGGHQFAKGVPSQAFQQTIPQRSFTRGVPGVSGQFDNPGQLYVGTFGGGFGN